MADKIQLSRLERYSLSNQLRILEVLYPDEAKALAVQREAIERGYEMIYSWYFEHIYDGSDVMTEEESKEVWDTFEMFDAIHRSIDALQASDLASHNASKFRGYDGNSETKFMTFAEFTVERLERFDYLPMARKGHWNSHMPMRDVYARMLKEWKKVPRERRFELSRAEVEAILGASVYPER
jgi:uncharacterized protein YfbU (UPF0304 family)